MISTYLVDPWKIKFSYMNMCWIGLWDIITLKKMKNQSNSKVHQFSWIHATDLLLLVVTADGRISGADNKSYLWLLVHRGAIVSPRKIRRIEWSLTAQRMLRLMSRPWTISASNNRWLRVRSRVSISFCVVLFESNFLQHKSDVNITFFVNLT